MNDAAAAALRIGTEPLYGDTVLDAELQAILAAGLVVCDGALLFAKFTEQHPLGPGDVARAIERMGWRDLTYYECQHNSFHLDDETTERWAPNQDGVGTISEPDQVALLRRGLFFARRVGDLACALPEPWPVRCIIGANDTGSTYRFHKLRDGEQWLADNLDDYRLEKIATFDCSPAGKDPQSPGAVAVMSISVMLEC